MLVLDIQDYISEISKISKMREIKSYYNKSNDDLETERIRLKANIAETERIVYTTMKLHDSSDSQSSIVSSVNKLNQDLREDRAKLEKISEIQIWLEEAYKQKANETIHASIAKDYTAFKVSIGFFVFLFALSIFFTVSGASTDITNVMMTVGILNLLFPVRMTYNMIKAFKM